MSDKVKLPRELAEALDSLREKGYSNFTILSYVINEKYIAHLPEITTIVKAYERDDFSFDTLLNALVNGYEIEKSPEDKVRAYYEFWSERAKDRDYETRTEAENKLDGMLFVLDAYGIKIPGVNADE
jgi:uncharacterized protein (UPF0297 family)